MRFMITNDFVNKKLVLIAIDSIESIYEDDKMALNVDLNDKKMKEIWEELPQHYSRIEMKNGSFYPSAHSLEELIQFLTTGEHKETEDENGESNKD